MGGEALDDRRLVERCLRGDSSAFDGIYDRHAIRVYNLLRRLSGNEAMAEDLTQETLVAAYRFLGSWRGRGELGTWVCGIAVRLYANSRRADSIADTLCEELIPADIGSDPLQNCAEAESIRQMESAILALPDIYRDVFVLVKVEGWSYRESAEMLQIPLGTVQSRLWKAVRILQASLADPRVIVESATAECRA